MNKSFLLLMFLPIFSRAQYTGTASVTRGLATTVTTNLYTCAGGRIAGLGTIKAQDSTVWTVPAVVNFSNLSFPFASDLHNPCNGNNYANSTAALAALNGSDIVTVDASGEVITAYIFADNYFEMYINGTPVGKDNVPFTQFNSNIIRFKVNRPFTIAMLLVDWEEHLGLGSEVNGPSQYHNGDGGMVAVFKDAKNNTIAITGNNWKAQTFYTSPIADLTCPKETGTMRSTSLCSTADVSNGSLLYGLHWERPNNWTKSSFDFSNWPAASVYSNATVGVDNKSAYTNFVNIFDDSANDAQFIWSTNLILDNEVIVRYTVPASTGIINNGLNRNEVIVYPNPATKEFKLSSDESTIIENISKIIISNLFGEVVLETDNYKGAVNTENISPGIYFLTIETNRKQLIKKLIIE